MTIIFGCFKESYNQLVTQEDAQPFGTWFRIFDISEPDVSDRILVYPTGKRLWFLLVLGFSCIKD